MSYTPYLYQNLPRHGLSDIESCQQGLKDQALVDFDGLGKRLRGM